MSGGRAHDERVTDNLRNARPVGGNLNMLGMVETARAVFESLLLPVVEAAALLVIVELH